MPCMASQCQRRSTACERSFAAARSTHRLLLQELCRLVVAQPQQALLYDAHELAPVNELPGSNKLALRMAIGATAVLVDLQVVPR